MYISIILYIYTFFIIFVPLSMLPDFSFTAMAEDATGSANSEKIARGRYDMISIIKKVCEKHMKNLSINPFIAMCFWLV